MNKRILFVRPDLNSTFAQLKALEKLEIKAKIFLGLGYPKKLLFDENKVVGAELFKNKSTLYYYLNLIINFCQFIFFSLKSDYLIYYGSPPLFKQLDRRLGKNSFSFELFLMKNIFRKFLIFNPTGCREEFLKKDFEKFDKGNICNNCGFYEKCNDVENSANFKLINKYFDLSIGYGFNNSNQYVSNNFRYKSIDLELFSPNILIPERYRLEKFNGITIYHSNFLKESGRQIDNKKNIKGTPAILKAIKKLKKDGYKIRELIIENKKMADMRYYQSQADIVVDQLIYGTWGSTAIECMALGKPVICYLYKDWKSHYLKNFGYSELPIIEANTKNIYDVLKSLLDNPLKIKEFGLKSRKFVELHYNPTINTKILLDKLQELTD